MLLLFKPHQAPVAAPAAVNRPSTSVPLPPLARPRR